MSFFRMAKQTMAGGARLEVSKIKSLLTQKLVEREKDVVERKVKGKYLPLSVWAKQGFDTTAIEKSAEKQKSDMFLDWVGFCLKVCLSYFLLVDFVWLQKKCFDCMLDK